MKSSRTSLEHKQRRDPHPMDLSAWVEEINGLMIDCLKREVGELKAQKEDLKAEMEKREKTHKAIIAGYQDKVKKCNHTLETMLEVEISKDVLIDVVRDLIADIIP